MNLPLTEQLKKLRLLGVAETFENRLSQARENALSHSEWLSLLLQDEIQRREAQGLAKRFNDAKFEEEKTFENFQFNRYPLKTQQLIRDLMTNNYLQEHQHLHIVGPTGTGKTHLGQAFGHNACRQGKKVRFIRAAVLLREIHASRADRTWEKTLQKFIAFDLLIIDDFGLSGFTLEQAEDLYELIAERHLKSSFILTSNRKVEAWVNLFPDPAMGNAAIDRLANKGHHLVLEGESYRRHSRNHLSPEEQEEKEDKMPKT
jgi:DNA replication protein DnaC